MVDLKEFEQKAADLRVLGMKISIGQDTVYEKYWDEDCRRNIYSASKSFTSCAVGFAVQEGLIDLDERLMDAFKEDIPNNPDENLKKATVKDLLTMTLGQEKGFLMGKQRPRMEELLGYCMRSDVGAVGARMYYEDDTIQHAGVVIGFGGIAGHCFVLQPRGTTGYCHRIICAQDYSAVTAACMMVKKEAFDKVGGLTEELAVAFNDIDFCMKLRAAGYLIVYNPYAELYHYESKSRGLEDTPEKVARFNKEIQIFEKRWPDILRNGDPYYNPNLTLKSQDFSLRRI